MQACSLFLIQTNMKKTGCLWKLPTLIFPKKLFFMWPCRLPVKIFFEKQILSIFHNAKIIEKPDDYNIFNETGHTAGVQASFSKNPIYPLKTYESFIHDPLNAILSSFSKVNRDGEGPAIQLIWSPVGEKICQKIQRCSGQNFKRHTTQRSH